MPEENKLDLNALENKIKYLIQKKGITQANLASKLNMSQSMFNKHLKGHPCFTIDEVYSIAQYFHVSIDFLCSNTLAETLPLEDNETPENTIIRNAELYKTICNGLAFLFKNAYLITDTIKIQEIVYEEDIDLDHWKPFHRIRVDSEHGRHDPINEYPSIGFSNYYPFPKTFDSDEELSSYISDLESEGNRNPVNYRINRFLKKLVDLHKVFCEGSITYEDYVRSIDSNLASALTETK